jgi:hypothetical protein
VPVTAPRLSGQLTLAPDDQAAPEALRENLFGRELEVEFEHDVAATPPAL